MKKTSINLVIAVCTVLCSYLFFYFSQKASQKEVVIIDKSLENFQELINKSKKDALVILVENSDDGFALLEAKISSLKDIERMHILTHGTSGNFTLGGQQLEERNVDRFSSFWKAVSQSFASGKSELFIYSCQLAADVPGKSFVDRLHSLLDVAVASSVDNTGLKVRGGNWDLEYIAGNIKKDHVLKYLDFPGLLIPQFTQFTGSASPFNAVKIGTDNQFIYGDFDSDGDIDIHSYDGSSPLNDFWRNNGSGSFEKVTGTASPFANVEENAVFYSADKAFVADWDNDGDDDIYVTMRSSSKNEKNFFYRNDSGKYILLSGAASPFANITVSGYIHLIYGDFDNDGDIDLHSYPGNQLDSEFWRNNGTGVFTKVTGGQNPFNNLPGKAAFSSAEYTYVKDWDNDGDVDILTTQRGNVSVKDYYRNENGVYALQTGSANPFNSMTIATNNQILSGDFDSDGDIDVHTSNGSNTLIFWRNNGSGTFTQVTGADNPFNSQPNGGVFDSNAKYAFVADWDNDKDEDVFTTRYNATKQNYFFRQNDAPPLITATSPSNLGTGVSVSGNISLTFSRPVSGVAGKNIRIHRYDNNSVFTTIATNSAQLTGAGTATITIDPSSDLAGATGYYLTIDKGAFTDSDGRIFAGVNSSATLRFTTGIASTIAAVTTAPVTDFSQTNAQLGGSVTSDGNAPVSDRGIVWSTSPSPTISSGKVQIGSGAGSFTKSVTELPKGTHIYVRAYAINSVGTAYGSEVDFYTKTTVSSIVRQNASPTNASQIAYNVTFANSVVNLDGADFTLTTSGVTGAAVSGVSGSGNSYVVTVNTGSGNGTVRLDFTGTSSTQPMTDDSYTSAAPYLIYKTSGPSDYYRTKISSASWNQQASWESSQDNGFWIQATSFPDAASAIVTVLYGQSIILPAGFNAVTGSLANAGSITLNSNTISANGTFSNAGILKGNGTFVNSNFTNSGIIAPGNSAGMVSFTGNLVNNGVVNIEIGAATAVTGYDQVRVTGNITLSGTLNVTLINGYQPGLGDEFLIIDAAASTGSFSTVNLPNIAPRIWQTTYENSNGTVLLKVVNDPLPVTLINFAAVKKEAASQLSWITSQEANSSHFEIERSTNGRHWKMIGSVNAVTNSSFKTAYQYLDLSPDAGENLYRLKMIDRDGTFAFSNISAVIFDQELLKISIYPNPVSDRLLLSLKSTGEISGLVIYNSFGIAVRSLGSYSANGISVSGLPKGVYVLTIKMVDGRSVQNKFIKF